MLKIASWIHWWLSNQLPWVDYLDHSQFFQKFIRPEVYMRTGRNPEMS